MRITELRTYAIGTYPECLLLKYPVLMGPAMLMQLSVYALIRYELIGGIECVYIYMVYGV